MLRTLLLQNCPSFLLFLSPSSSPDSDIDISAASADATMTNIPLPPGLLPSSCDRHPDQLVTGFCASCLRERLAGLQPQPQKPSSSNPKSIKSILSIFGGGAAATPPPKLRRSQSFSGNKAEAGSTSLEPQRRSCDVRGQTTLSSLFHSNVPGLQFHSPSIQERDEEEIRPADPDPVRKFEDQIYNNETQASKKPGSLWLAASVFTKKLWRRRHKPKKSENDNLVCNRRSCDIERRFSLDAGRVSLDEPARFSWDRPRASWDGHLIGGRPMFGAGVRLPPMLALGEDGQNPAIERWDGRIPVEEDGTIPGGTVQTRDYYLDSSSRRRSLDISNSSRKQSFEFSEMKPVSSNARVSPAFFHGVKLDRDSRELSFTSLRGDSRELSSNSLRVDRVDRAESFESAFRDAEKGAGKKKSKRWSKALNIWGFIYRRGGGKGGERNSESVPEQVYNGNVFRSNSSVSLRSSIYNNSALGSTRRSNVGSGGIGKRRTGEVMLDRSRSARFSPGHVDNGLLRLYLTPKQGSRRNGLSEKGKHNTSCSVAKTAVGMY